MKTKKKETPICFMTNFGRKLTQFLILEHENKSIII